MIYFTKFTKHKKNVSDVIDDKGLYLNMPDCVPLCCVDRYEVRWVQQSGYRAVISSSGLNTDDRLVIYRCSGEPEEVWEHSLRRSISESFLRRSRSPPTNVRRSLSCSPPPKKKMGRPPLKVGLICPWCELPKGSTEENLRRHERDCLVRLDIQGGKPLPYKTGSLSWKTRAARKGR